MQRLLCFGGRDFTDGAAVDAALSRLAPLLTPFAIIDGKARGADSLCGECGKARGVPVIEVPANWGWFYRGVAGPVRNQWMLDACLPTYALGFPGGADTADMSRRLRMAGVPLRLPRVQG